MNLTPSRCKQLTEQDLDRHIDATLPNAADSLPYRLQTEPDHIGADWTRPSNVIVATFPREARDTTPPNGFFWPDYDTELRDSFVEPGRAPKTDIHTVVWGAIGLLCLIGVGVMLAWRG